MIKIDNNSDKLIISHISDIDGMGSVILAKLIFNIDVYLLAIEEVRDTLNDLVKNNKYKEIYMCDLSIPDDMADMLDGKLPLKHFDHHQTNTYVSKYDWSIVISEINGFKPSGTSLFYDYLVNNYNEEIIHSEKVKQFVEAVRSYDTWDFVNTKNMLGKYLTMIFSMYGQIKFIDTFYNRLLDDNINFELNDLEKSLIEIKTEEMENYINDCDKNLIKTKFLDYNVGITISELFRSELGNRLSEKYKNELDFILIVDFHRRSYSTRTVNDIDLGEICKKLGGGGHKKAAGFPMNKENNELILGIIKDNLNKSL